MFSCEMASFLSMKVEGGYCIDNIHFISKAKDCNNFLYFILKEQRGN